MKQKIDVGDVVYHKYADAIGIIKGVYDVSVLIDWGFKDCRLFNKIVAEFSLQIISKSDFK